MYRFFLLFVFQRFSSKMKVKDTLLTSKFIYFLSEIFFPIIYWEILWRNGKEILGKLFKIIRLHISFMISRWKGDELDMRRGFLVWGRYKFCDWETILRKFPLILLHWHSRDSKTLYLLLWNEKIQDNFVI